MTARASVPALDHLLPGRLDGAYRGHAAGLWLLGAVLFVRTGIALGCLFNGRMAAQSADGVPLDALGAAGAQAVVSLFGLWGLAQLVISAIGLLALARYRALVPLVSALLLVEHLARRALLLVRPVATAGVHPGVVVNLVLLTATAAALGFALWEQGDAPGPA